MEVRAVTACDLYKVAIVVGSQILTVERELEAGQPEGLGDPLDDILAINKRVSLRGYRMLRE